MTRHEAVPRQERHKKERSKVGRGGSRKYRVGCVSWLEEGWWLIRLHTRRRKEKRQQRGRERETLEWVVGSASGFTRVRTAHGRTGKRRRQRIRTAGDWRLERERSGVVRPLMLSCRVALSCWEKSLLVHLLPYWRPLERLAQGLGSLSVVASLGRM